ncbi:MerR family transcriptional regulator [Devosia sp. RR2S18]|uniref:MerR family transcriptional regulator n=1 Tax=Devosia rhizosphaerae TaxID=3049774 RepID=UPI0025404E70|nr:MerR family transcriptional regulator [Devosia sp. RR2S18]WIJ26444.1 hypothetical protein QOV41_06695 [Devosia sp. RR2S18]
MSNPFFEKLDHLIYTAGDVQRMLPIEPSRLQMLVKRHFPTIAAREGRNRRYSPRMIIWVSLTSQLMDLGVSVSTAAHTTQFAFGGSLDLMYSRLADEDIEQIKRIARTYAVAHPTTMPGEPPQFGLVDIEPQWTGGWALMIPLGMHLIELGNRFNAGRSAEPGPTVQWA